MLLLYKKGAREQAIKQLGINELYLWQTEAVNAILNDEDVFVTAPTGGGKSVLFQLPAIMELGRALTIVISPLRALQYDQTQALKRKGIPAECLNSDLSDQERKRVLDNLHEICLLYLAPEQLQKKDLCDALKAHFVSCIAVDEAHILPQTELEFRPAYGKINEFIHSLADRPRILACTATATVKDRGHIIESLGMRDPKIFTWPVRRDNLQLFVKEIKANKQSLKLEDNMFHAVERAISQQRKKDSIIVYSPTVKRAEKLQQWLSGRRYKVGLYTGETPQKERKKVQKDFITGETPIVVATNAFGLGIDKPDVRLIIHAGMPLTLSGYTQEIGRAGRDGASSTCLLFYTSKDFEKNKRILSYSDNRKAVRRGIKGLNALKDRLDSRKCLWCGIETYYGEKPGKSCGHCSNCVTRKINKYAFSVED